jgi:hypothetical protein
MAQQSRFVLQIVSEADAAIHFVRNTLESDAVVARLIPGYLRVSESFAGH